MKKIRIGVIPAAGRGARIAELPMIKILPKPMLPILNKPILEYAIENIKSLGVEDLYIVVGPKKELIQEYFGDGEDFSLHITYLEQKSPKGIAQAISLTKNYINEPFAVILGDDLTIAGSLNNLAESFWKRNAWAIEGVVSENDVEVLKRTCCVILKDTEKIEEIVEKPFNPRSNLRGIGIYIFDPKVFCFIESTPLSNKRNEKEITDTIGLIAREEKAYGILINGTNINVNTPSDFIEATKLLLGLKK